MDVNSLALWISAIFNSFIETIFHWRIKLQHEKKTSNLRPFFREMIVFWITNNRDTLLMSIEYNTLSSTHSITIPLRSHRNFNFFFAAQHSWTNKNTLSSICVRYIGCKRTVNGSHCYDGCVVGKWMNKKMNYNLTWKTKKKNTHTQQIQQKYERTMKEKTSCLFFWYDHEWSVQFTCTKKDHLSLLVTKIYDFCCHMYVDMQTWFRFIVDDYLMNAMI